MPVTACFALSAGFSVDPAVYSLTLLLCWAQSAAFGEASKNAVPLLVLGKNPLQYRRAMLVP